MSYGYSSILQYLRKVLLGREEHLLAPGEIEVIRTDRGGQVTYHGPGQIVVYVLCDIRRAKLGVRDLVTGLEQAIIAFLSEFGLVAEADPKAPGVYVSGEKIASLGLKLVEDLAITVSRLM